MSDIVSHNIKVGSPLGNPPRRRVTSNLWLQQEEFTREQLQQLRAELQCVSDAMLVVERALVGEYPPEGGSR